jgi:thiol-disulfide isomerase/thioredoxin
MIGLYFGASWCGYCLRFNPLLEILYRKTPRDKFEIVYVSSCTTEEEHKAYVKDMPWPSVPYQDARIIGYVRKAIRDQTGQQQGRLATMFNVTGLPSLILLDSNGRVVRSDARQDLQAASRVDDAMAIWETALKRGAPAGGGEKPAGGVGWTAAGGIALAGAAAAACLLRAGRRDPGTR